MEYEECSFAYIKYHHGNGGRGRFIKLKLSKVQFHELSDGNEGLWIVLQGIVKQVLEINEGDLFLLNRGLWVPVIIPKFVHEVIGIDLTLDHIPVETWLTEEFEI